MTKWNSSDSNPSRQKSPGKLSIVVRVLEAVWSFAGDIQYTKNNYQVSFWNFYRASDLSISFEGLLPTVIFLEICFSK